MCDMVSVEERVGFVGNASLGRESTWSSGEVYKIVHYIRIGRHQGPIFNAPTTVNHK